MNKKPSESENKQIAEGLRDAEADSGAYVVEEQVLERNQYDNTTSFQMDVEKAKAMATSQRHADNANAGDSNLPHVHTRISEEEKERIKQSLAELREIEQEQYDEDNGVGSGFFGKIKRLFSNK
jgi:hypothetical protein